MKIAKATAQWVFIICLPVLLITASVSGAMNCRWLYEYGFNKYDISSVTGLEQAELTKAAGGLISYFNSDEKYITLSVVKDGKPFQLFNEREAEHLKDVKGLFRLVYKLLQGTVIYALIYLGSCLFWWREKGRLARGLFGGGILTLGLMLALGAMIMLDFDRFFLQFHLLSFANDFWMLDPSMDYLIMLFPQGFWLDATAFCAAGAAAGAIILGGAGWRMLRKDKRTTD